MTSCQGSVARPRLVPLRLLSGRVLAVALAAWLAAFGPARAAESDARAFVEMSGREFLALVEAAPDSADARTAQVAEFLERRVALKLIARFAAGRNWRQMSADQRDRYRCALRDLAARFLAARIEEMQETDFQILRVTAVPDRKGRAERTQYIVVTKVTSALVEPLQIEWRITPVRGELRISDFTIEGVSLLLSYRGEAAALFEQHGGDADAVIASILARTGG